MIFFFRKVDIFEFVGSGVKVVIWQRVELIKHLKKGATLFYIYIESDYYKNPNPNTSF